MPVQAQLFINIFLSAVLVVIVPPIAYRLFKWLQAREKDVEASLSASQLDTLRYVADLAVKAAQQSGLADLIANTGEEKKAWAITFAQTLLNELGLPEVSAVTLAGLIEAGINAGVHLPAATIIATTIAAPTAANTVIAAGDQ